MYRTLQDLRLRSDTTDVVFGSSHISQPVLSHLACCPRLKRLTVSSAELMSVDLGALRFLDQLQVRHGAWSFCMLLKACREACILSNRAVTFAKWCAADWF